MENAETSAVGRALAMMGIGVIDSIASVDELNKAKNRGTGTKTQTTPKTAGNGQNSSDTAPKKQCPYCEKWHTGRYPKCMDCWKKEQNGEVLTKKKTVVNTEVPPFEDDHFAKTK